MLPVAIEPPLITVLLVVVSPVSLIVCVLVIVKPFWLNVISFTLSYFPVPPNISSELWALIVPFVPLNWTLFPSSTSSSSVISGFKSNVKFVPVILPLSSFTAVWFTAIFPSVLAKSTLSPLVISVVTAPLFVEAVQPLLVIWSERSLATSPSWPWVAAVPAASDFLSAAAVAISSVQVVLESPLIVETGLPVPSSAVVVILTPPITAVPSLPSKAILEPKPITPLSPSNTILRLSSVWSPPKYTLSFNATWIALFVVSAVTVILLSPAKFNVVVPLSVGFTSILFVPSVATQPASTFWFVAYNWLPFTASFDPSLTSPSATFVIVVPFVPANATVLLFSLYLTAFSPTSDKLYLLLSASAIISLSLETLPSLAILNTVSLSLLVIEIMLSFCGFPFNWIRVPDSSPKVMLSFKSNVKLVPVWPTMIFPSVLEKSTFPLLGTATLLVSPLALTVQPL